MTETQKLQSFKAYVHKRLDAMGVPENPEPARTLETGCRIGPRLDWIVGRLTALSEVRAEVEAEAERNAASDLSAGAAWCMSLLDKLDA